MMKRYIVFALGPSEAFVPGKLHPWRSFSRDIHRICTCLADHCQFFFSLATSAVTVHLAIFRLQPSTPRPAGHLEIAQIIRPDLVSYFLDSLYRRIF